MESMKSFCGRVLERSGLRVEQIPSADAGVMLDGAIILRSQYGVLVYLDPVGKDDDGIEQYTRCVLVHRSTQLSAAAPDATGVLPEN